MVTPPQFLIFDVFLFLSCLVLKEVLQDPSTSLAILRQELWID